MPHWRICRNRNQIGKRWRLQYGRYITPNRLHDGSPRYRFEVITEEFHATRALAEAARALWQRTKGE